MRRHSLHEIALVVRLDQVRDRLGVRLGGKRVALGEQALAELAVVLDDAVEHDRELAAVAAGKRCAFPSVTPPCVAQRVWPSPSSPASHRGLPRSSDSGGCRPRACSGARRSPGARSRPSRSRGTPGARGRRGGAACTHGSPTYPMIPHTAQASSRLAENPLKPREPGLSRAPRTSCAILPQRSLASSSLSASARTRTTGSVPDGRTSTRPRPSRRSVSAAASSRID